MKNILPALAGIGFLLLLPAQTMAHGGGLNRYGCHNETATGGYHCHRNSSGNSGSSGNNAGSVPKGNDGWRTAGYVVGGLVIVWVVLNAACDDEALGVGPLQVAPHFSERGDAGISAEYSTGRSGAIGLRAETLADAEGESIFKAYWRLRF